jgi:hypothetical protein
MSINNYLRNGVAQFLPTRKDGASLGNEVKNWLALIPASVSSILWYRRIIWVCSSSQPAAMYSLNPTAATVYGIACPGMKGTIPDNDAFRSYCSDPKSVPGRVVPSLPIFSRSDGFAVVLLACALGCSVMAAAIEMSMTRATTARPTAFVISFIVYHQEDPPPLGGGRNWVRSENTFAARDRYIPAECFLQCDAPNRDG